MSRTVYTFANADFWREGDEIIPWFYGESQYTLDAVLGGTASYLDIGTTTYPPLSFRAWCASAAARNALIAARGTTGTLSNTRGHSGSATLVKATPVNFGVYSAAYAIDLMFEYRP